MRVSRFNREFRGTFDAGEVETVGGFLLREYGELPPEGTRITLGHYAFEIVGLRANRIESILARNLAAAADAEPPPDDTTPKSAGAHPGESPESAASGQPDREPGED